MRITSECLRSAMIGLSALASLCIAATSHRSAHADANVTLPRHGSTSTQEEPPAIFNSDGTPVPLTPEQSRAFTVLLDVCFEDYDKQFGSGPPDQQVKVPLSPTETVMMTRKDLLTEYMGDCVNDVGPTIDVLKSILPVQAAPVSSLKPTT
ncbi:MAG: hypothetical protein P4M11_09665 [Candidatus Pacebacteria bacterium]|nr:hypothetical protein [Candidatus Paceibacterota bacterium]